MLKVRLQRVGRKNNPSFRVVVVDSKRGPKSGDYIEMVGSHNPRTKQTTVKNDRIQHWLSVGAQASPTVHNMLVKGKIIDGKMINVLPKKSPVIKETTDEEKAPEASTDSSEPSEDTKEAVVEEEKKEEESKAPEESTAPTEEAPEGKKD